MGKCSKCEKEMKEDEIVEEQRFPWKEKPTFKFICLDCFHKEHSNEKT